MSWLDRMPASERAALSDAGRIGSARFAGPDPVRRDAHSHPHPEAGGLVLCGDCAAEAREEGKVSEPLTHAQMEPWWLDRISVANPRFCDNCCAPVVAADAPEVA